MAVLSVPLTAHLQKIIQDLLDWGVASNKADAARKALERMHEEAAVQVVLESEQQIADGNVLKGDLRRFLTE